MIFWNITRFMFFAAVSLDWFANITGGIKQNKKEQVSTHFSQNYFNLYSPYRRIVSLQSQQSTSSQSSNTSSELLVTSTREGGVGDVEWTGGGRNGGVVSWSRSAGLTGWAVSDIGITRSDGLQGGVSQGDGGGSSRSSGSSGSEGSDGGELHDVKRKTVSWKVTGEKTKKIGIRDLFIPLAEHGSFFGFSHEIGSCISFVLYLRNMKDVLQLLIVDSLYLCVFVYTTAYRNCSRSHGYIRQRVLKRFGTALVFRFTPNFPYLIQFVPSFSYLFYFFFLLFVHNYSTVALIILI